MLERALLTPEARSALRKFSRWLDDAIVRLHILVGLRTMHAGYRGWWPTGTGHPKQILHRLFPDLCKESDEYLVRSGHSDARARLAYWRILEPLLHAADTDGIELDWQELSSTDLRKFVRAGIQRERIALKRSPDAQRAQELY